MAPRSRSIERLSFHVRRYTATLELRGGIFTAVSNFRGSILCLQKVKVRRKGHRKICEPPASYLAVTCETLASKGVHVDVGVRTPLSLVVGGMFEQQGFLDMSD